MPRALRLNPRQRRTFLSALFSFTAAVSVATVAGSDVLPCPARSSTLRYADGAEEEQEEGRTLRKPVVEKRPRRWIEESIPQRKEA